MATRITGAMPGRRHLAAGIGIVLAGRPAGASPSAARLVEVRADAVAARLRARLGLVVADLATGLRVERDADDRFPLTSTFKAFAAAAVLAKVDAGTDDLDRRIRIPREALVPYSPVTETRIGAEGMRLGEICEAACGLSDNTAGNLLLDAIGGPPGFTAFMHGIGDGVTRLDRGETALNEGRPGDPRDTTSPRAAAASLEKLLLGQVLSAASRDRLRGWMTGNRVAGPLVRAALPEGWVIADRSGAGGHGSRAIVAVMWPPGRAPLVAAIYLTATEASMAERNAAIADIGSAIVAGLAR